MMSSNSRIYIEVSLQSGRRQIEVKFAAIARGVVIPIASRPPLGSTKPHIQWVLGKFPPEIIIIIMIIIIISISFIHGIHSYVPQTNPVPRGYTVAATLSFYCQYAVRSVSPSFLQLVLMVLYVSTSRRMRCSA
jgi:hypothetical protein